MIPPLPKLAVLLVHYSNIETTAQCLGDLLAQDYPSFALFITDNSTDQGDMDWLAERFTNEMQEGLIHWNHLGENLGYGGGMNRAAAEAQKWEAELFLVINNDTRMAPDFLRGMVQGSFNLLEREDFGLSVPLILEGEGPGVYYAGGHLDLKRCMGVHHLLPLSGDEPQEVDFATGCCWLIRAKRYAELEGFIEDYFLYFEDFDFCYRLDQAGYRQYFLPQVTLHHDVGGSTGGDDSPIPVYYGTRNRILWMERNGLAGWGFYLFYFTSRLIKAMVWLLTGKWGILKPLTLGLIDGLRGQIGKSRRVI